MRYLPLTLATLAGVALLLVALSTLPPNPERLAAERYAQARAEAQANALAPLDLALAAAWRVLPLGAVGVALALATRWAWLALGRYDRERHPDRNGLLPVRSDALGDLAPPALGAWHVTRLAEATRPQAPHTLHYRPQTTATTATTAPSAPIPGAEAPGLPGVVDLATLSYRPSIDRILLGLASGNELITVGARALCHVALLGATGQGKTAALRLLIPQLLALRGRVVIIDPHYTDYDAETGEDWRAIRPRLYQAPAVSPGEIDNALGYLTEEIDRRMELRREGQTVGPPIWAAFDELPRIVDSVPRATERLTYVLREGRKIGVFAIGASQSMLVKSLGGDSTARECYRTAYYAGGDQRSATALLDLPAREIPEGALGRGVVMLRSAARSTPTLARVPWASNEAIEGLLAPHASPLHPGNPDAGPEARSEAGANNPLPGHPNAQGAPPAQGVQLDPEQLRIVARFRAGASVTELSRELSGVTGGRAYQDAAERVAEALRRGLARGGDL